MRRKILFFDFVTTYGGVQSVLVNLLPRIQEHFDILFLDPYEDPVTAQRMKRAGVKRVHLQIWPPHKSLGWQIWYKKIIALLCFSLSYGWCAIRLVRFLQRGKVSVIYTNSKKGVIFSALVSLIARVPLIYQAHGFRSANDIGWFYRQAIKRAAVVIAVSEDVRKKLIDAGVPSVKIITVYNGVPVEAIRHEAEQADKQIDKGIFNIHSDKVLRILLAANLQPDKGVHVAIEAAKNLLERGIKCELWIAGKIPPGGDKVYVTRLRQMVKSWNLDREIKFLGWIENIYWLMSRADVIIVPSLVEESFGMVLAEAMALGKPTIGSRIGGVPEVIQDSVTGFLITPGSAEELSGKLALLAKDRSLRETMGEHGYERVCHLFTVERQASEIDKILNEACSGQGVTHE